jgi:hypothetical protein
VAQHLPEPGTFRAKNDFEPRAALETAEMQRS